MTFLLATVLALTAAQPKKSTAAGVQTAVRQADAQRCAAAAARDFERFLALLADDVEVYPSEHPIVKGVPAAREFFAPFFDPKGPKLSCEPLTVEVAASGDLAYTTGTYLTKGTEAERGPTRGHGKYVTVWRKRGGRWRVAVDIGNASPPKERDFGPPPPP